MFKALSLGTFAVLLFLSVLRGMGFHGAAYNKYVGGALEDPRHSVFKNSQSYNDGMVTELQNMRFEYLRALPEQKEMLAGVIRHRAATFQGDMPYDLRNFINSLQ